VQTVNQTNCAAVIDAVDNPQYPGVVSVIIGDSLPSQSGFTWNASFSQTFAEAPATTISTTATTATGVGNTIVFTPSSMASITEGQQLVVGNETLIVRIITATTFTAAATKSHSVGTVIATTGPPNGTIYYNNRTSHTGGTIVYVDIQARTVISVTHNVSTLVAQDYSLLFQYIKHTGAYNPTHSFQQPYPIDNSQVATNPNPALPPTFLVTPHNRSGTNEPFDYIIGSGNTQIVTQASDDAETSFTLSIGTELWLAAIRMFILPSGQAFDTSADNGDIVPTPSGQYTCIFNGLGAGKQYDCYIAFVDMASNVGSPTLVGTTALNAMQIARLNQAYLDQLGPPSAQNVSLGAVISDNPGTTSATYDQTVNWTGNLYQSTADVTVAEIHLMACRSGHENTGGLNAGWYKVGSIPPASPPTNGYPVFAAIWPTLGAGNSYDLGIRLEGWAGDVSAITLLVTTNGNGQYFGPATMPTMNAPTILSAQLGTIQNSGSATCNIPLQCLTGDWGANGAPPWFAGARFYWRQHTVGVPTSPPWTGILCGINGPQGRSLFGTALGYEDNFYALALGIPSSVLLDFGLSYVDQSGAESYIAWPGGAWSETTPPQVIVVVVTNVNLVANSDMINNTASTGAAYWTYAGWDNQFLQIGTNTSDVFINYLAANTGGTGTEGIPVCAYSTPIGVRSGQVYTLSLTLGNLNEGHQGQAFFGIVAMSDKSSNNGTPQVVYSSKSLQRYPATAILVLPPWTATLTGNIVVALWGYSISGSAIWCGPQFEAGSTNTSYKAGSMSSSQSSIQTMTILSQ